MAYQFNHNQDNWLMGARLQSSQKSVVLIFYLILSSTAEMKGKHICQLIIFDSS